MNKPKGSIPHWGRRWIAWVVPRSQCWNAVHEWEEVFTVIERERGRLAASLWLFWQGAATMRDCWLFNVRNSGLHIRQWGVQFLRLFRQDRLFTWLNIAGLAVGLAAAIEVQQWTYQELQYERCHAKAGSIVRVIENFAFSDQNEARYAMIPGIFGPALPEALPEAVRCVRYRPGGEVAILKAGGLEQRVQAAMADSGYFDLFSFKLLHGQAGALLHRPDGAVLSEKTALTLFGRPDVVGEILDIPGHGRFEVTGVVAPPGGPTHMRFDLMVPLVEGRRMGIPSQQFLFYETFLELHQGTELDRLRDKIKNLPETIAPGTPAEVAMDVQPLLDMHLHSRFDIDVAGHGSADTVKTLQWVSILILAMAVFNFINLSTARSVRRAREVGLRKTLGASRSSLVRQFFGESLSHVLLAALLALVLMTIAQPAMNALLGQPLAWTTLLRGGMLLRSLVILGGTGLAAGLYPAFTLSQHNPLTALRLGRLQGGQRKALRRTLVLIQFLLSAVLLSLTFIGHHQMGYLMAHNGGYDRDHLLALDLDGNARQEGELIKSLMAGIPGVSQASLLSEMPVNLSRATDYLDWPGKVPEDVQLFSLLFCDAASREAMGLKMAEGRFFSDAHSRDADHYVLNETAARRLGLGNVVGSSFTMWEQTGRVIGIVKDFHFQSLHQPIQPLIMKLNTARTEVLLLRLEGQNSKILHEVDSLWREAVPGSPLKAYYLSDRFVDLHRDDQRFSRLFMLFTLLALTIGGMGVLGLVAFMVQQRTREFSIRRVLGAPARAVLALLSGDLLLWVLVANALAAPCSYWLAKSWLRRFAYAADVQPWPFVLTAAVSLSLVMMVASALWMKALARNPARILRE